MNLEELYTEASELSSESRIFFRGFSIEKNDSVIITDVRSPYYKDISDKDLEVLKKRGFVKGTTYLLMLSDNLKIDKFLKLLRKQEGYLKITKNPRKKQEYMNSIARYKSEISYYTSQVGRWLNLI